MRAVVVLTLLGALAGGQAGSAPPGGAPPGATTELAVAGALAVSSSGALYVVDEAHDRVLVRLGDGEFRVVAGDGKVGFSGDGGPATDAELSDVSNLTFGPEGALYMVDGPRVRAVGPDGVVRTVAGDGRSPHPVANGSLALTAALGPEVHIASSRHGQLYIATSSQLLRLSAGRFYTVRAVVRSGPMKGNFDRNLLNLALDAEGNIDVEGFDGWQIWRIAPHGSAIYVGYDRGSGGSVPDMQRGPDGAVYAEDGSEVLRVTATGLAPAYDLGLTIKGQYFSLWHFAFGLAGVVYADDVPGGRGFERYQQLIQWKDGHVRLLWQEA